MRSRTTKRFRDQLAALPAPVRRQAHDAYRLFIGNPSHPSLHLKPVRLSDPVLYSVRISRSYRALGIRDVDGTGMLWIWIGSHADYDRVINRS